MSKTNFLAVYGTLKREFNLPIMKKVGTAVTYAGKCIIPGTMYNFERYPALVPGEGKVYGELFKLQNESVLKILDAYEAVDNQHKEWPGFKRSKINLIEPKTAAWIYIYTGSLDGVEIVTSGEWHA